MNFYRKAVAGATPESASKKFGIKDKLTYMCGDIGCNMSFALNSYLMLFWTQYMGFSNNPDPVAASAETLAIWGVIILCLKIWDAINDPIIGGLVDLIKPKPGQSKFKPWIFWGSFALVFAGALCFIPIKTAPVPLKIIVCVIGYLLWDMAYTIVNVPYGSLNSVITANPDERASLSTFRSIGAMVAGMVLGMGIPMIIFEGGQSTGNILGERLIIVGLVCGIVGIVCFQILCRGTTERVIVDYTAQEEAKGEKFNYFKSLGAFFTNRAAVSYTLVSIFQLLAMAFMQTVSVNYIQIAFPEFAQMSGIVQMLSMLPMVAVIPFATKLVKKFGKKEACTWPNLLGVSAGVLLLVIPAENIPGIVGVIVFLIPGIFMGLGISVNSLVGWAMVADCIDYQEYKTGKREEGVVYATYSLGRKLAQGVGSSLVSFLLIPTGFVAGGLIDPTTGNPSMALQPEGTSTNVRILLGLVYIVCFAIQFALLLWVYNLDKKTLAEVSAKLGRDENTIENAKSMDD